MTRLVLVVAVVGLATGALTQIGQSVLPAGWSQAANAISPWLLVAFLVGAAMPDRRSAVAAGAGALLLALVGYYGLVQIRFGYGGGTGSWILWGLGAVIGGPVFGAAGWSWRCGPLRHRQAALGLLAGAFVAEGGYLVALLGYLGEGVGFAIAGLLMPLLLGRSWPDRLGGYVALLPALALGAIGYAVLLGVYGLTASV